MENSMKLYDVSGTIKKESHRRLCKIDILEIFVSSAGKKHGFGGELARRITKMTGVLAENEFCDDFIEKPSEDDSN